MALPVLIIDRVCKRIGTRAVLADVSAEAHRGELVGLFGSNGAGKTTLLDVVSGFVGLDSGTLTLNRRALGDLGPIARARMGVARTFQEVRLLAGASVIENVLSSFRNQSGERLLALVCARNRWHEEEARNMKRAHELLERFDLDHLVADAAGSLSFGQQKLLSLVCCLAADAELFLLDEPVAGVEARHVGSVLATLRHITSRGGTVLLAEHNLEVLRAVATRVIVMRAGRVVAQGDTVSLLDSLVATEAFVG